MGNKWATVSIDDIKLPEKYSCVGGPFGSSLSQKHYVDSGVPVIRGTNLAGDIFSESDFVFVSPDKANELQRNMAFRGDIVFTQRGTLGQVALIPEDSLYEKYIVSQSQMKLTVNPKQADAYFIYTYFRTNEAKALIENNAIIGGVPHINLGILKEFKLRLPPLSEQKRISEVSKSIDNKINLNRQINQTLEQMSQTLFKSWFVDFDPVIDNALDAGNPIPEALQSRAELRQKVRNSADFKPLPADIRALFPAEFEETELGWVPKGWCFKNLSSIYLCLDSKRIPLSKQERCQKQPGNIPYYGATSVMDYINEYIFDDILLLVGEDGSVIKDDNTPFIQYIWGKTWVNNHAHVLKGKDNISTEQLMLFMSQCNISAFVTGAVQMKINQKNMGSIQFLKAPDSINAAFNELIVPFFQKLRATKEQLSDLINLRDTLLPKLISGELSLEDLPDLVTQTEPA